MRRFIGFVAAIASVPLALSIAAAVVAMSGGSVTNRDWHDWSGTAVVFSIYAVPIALAVGLLVGLPVSLVIESAGFTSARAFALLGGLTGLGPFVVFDLIAMAFSQEYRAQRSFQFAAWWAALGAWCGVCAALVYWRIAVRPRR